MTASTMRHASPMTGSSEELGLNKSEIELCDAARNFSENAYAPYSGFQVGAAVRTSDGKVYGGANLENASYGLSMCAEFAALSNANTHSKHQVLQIAIYGRPDTISEASNAPVFPCGGGRQVIQEAATRHKRDIIVLACNADMTRFAKAGISKLLPNAFEPMVQNAGIMYAEEEAEMIEVIQSSLDERAEAFLNKDPMRRQKDRLLNTKDEKLESILNNISKRSRKQPL